VHLACCTGIIIRSPNIAQTTQKLSLNTPYIAN